MKKGIWMILLIGLFWGMIACGDNKHTDLGKNDPPVEGEISTPTPTPTEEVTLEPTKEVTPEPTKEVTPEPTQEVTPEPTKEVTPEPTKEVMPEPTKKPTPTPTKKPTPTPTKKPTPTPTKEVKPAYTYTDKNAVMYAKDAVNVRDLPSTAGNKIGILLKAQEVQVTGVCKETGWYRIVYGKQMGYVSNHYIISEKPVEPTPTAEPTQTITPTPTPTGDVVTIKISAAGDVTLGNTHLQDYSGTFRKEYDTQQDPSYFFRNVKSIFSADDMSIVNFEGVLTFSDERVEKSFNMKGDPEYVYILNQGDIEAVSFGNNHRMDYGQQGSDDTVAAFKEAGIKYAYDQYVGYYTTKGIKIGFVSVNEVYDGTAVEKYLKNGIKELQNNGADLIIACCHWGVETKHYIDDYQAQLGKKCIDWGADLVLGHHPHVLQGIEEYKGKYIVYSLGNFCFGGNRNPKNKESMIFQQTFTFVDGKLQTDDNIKVIPCYISSVMSRNNYQPTPAKGDDAKTIINHINQYSKSFGLKFDNNGLLVK